MTSRLEFGHQVGAKEATQPLLLGLPAAEGDPFAAEGEPQTIKTAAIQLFNGNQLGWGVLVPELQGLEGALEVGLLAVAPAHHVRQELGQGLAGGLLPQGLELAGRRQPLGRRQLR